MRVREARHAGRRLALLFLVFGPGILVMLGENDGPSMLSYAATGATYGIGFFVPFIVLTFLMAYVVQEATVRIGIATHRGHAELIHQRFGPFWGTFALLDLAVVNVLTLVTEFVAIRVGCAFFGIPAWVAVAAGVTTTGAAMFSGRYFTWERIALVLAAANLLFIPAALLSHPSGAALGTALLAWSPLPHPMDAAFFTLVMANVGATVTPWMIFFQQSAVVDKGLTGADLGESRIDTAAGAAIAAVVAIAALVAAASLHAHRINAEHLSGVGDFATALRPYLDPPGATLFALGMVEAGLVATMTISTSTAYAVGEVLHCGRTLNLRPADEPAFYMASGLSVLVAAGVVLVPHAPLLAITITVNVIATLLMGPALLFVLLLANDREIMREHANSPLANIAGGAVIVGISILGVTYGALTVFQEVLRR